MKTAQDPRHLKRIHQMQALFGYSFQSTQLPEDITPIVQHMSTIDAKIVSAAPEWPIDKLAKIDLAILRLALFELIYVAKEPPKVIIDEAVELAKSYGNEHSAKFINGVLGTILKQL